VARTAVPEDTDPAADAMLVECWRSMTTDGRVELTRQLCLDIDRIARAGVAALHPTYSELEVCHELARRRYGRALADAAYSGLVHRG
jgi:hypothetical protein